MSDLKKKKARRKAIKRAQRATRSADTFEVRRYDEYFAPTLNGFKGLLADGSNQLRLATGQQVFQTNSESVARSCLAGSKAVMAVFKNGNLFKHNLSWLRGLGPDQRRLPPVASKPSRPAAARKRFR